MSDSNKGHYFDWARRVIRSAHGRVTPDGDIDETVSVLPLYITQRQTRSTFTPEQDDKKEESAINLPGTSGTTQGLGERVSTPSDDGSIELGSLEFGESVNYGSQFWGEDEVGDEGDNKEKKWKEESTGNGAIGELEEEDDSKWYDCHDFDAGKFYENSGELESYSRNTSARSTGVFLGIQADVVESAEPSSEDEEAPLRDVDLEKQTLNSDEPGDTNSRNEPEEQGKVEGEVVWGHDEEVNNDPGNIPEIEPGVGKPEIPWHPLDDLGDGNAQQENSINTEEAFFLDASTQTYFKQSFIKAWQRRNTGSRKKGRPTSEPTGKQAKRKNSVQLALKRNQVARNNWEKLTNWVHERRRSKRASLRGMIQGRGENLVIPGRPLVPPSIQSPHHRTHLDAYLDFMYYVCVSTRDVDNTKPNIQKTKDILQMVWFWVFSLLAIGHSIDLLKFSTMEFLEEGSIHDYVHLGFLLLYCILRIYSLLLHAFHNDKLRKMTKAMNDATLNATTSKYVATTAYAIGTGSLFLAILAALFGSQPIKEWSLKETFLLRAYEMSHAIFMWSTRNYTNMTKMLDSEYGSKITWTSLIMAVPELIMNFCGNLEDFVVGDLILTAAMSLHSNLNRFVKDIISRPAKTVTYPEFKEKWNEYQVLAEASDKFYETCTTLLTLYHMYNLLQFAVFLRFFLIKKLGNFLFITTSANVIKSITTYVIAVKIADQNQVCRNWVRQCALSSMSRKRQKNRKLYMKKAILILDEMRDNPLGLGRDELFINKGFLITLLGMATSLFLMLAEEATGEGGNKGPK